MEVDTHALDGLPFDILDGDYDEEVHVGEFVCCDVVLLLHVLLLLLSDCFGEDRLFDLRDNGGLHLLDFLLSDDRVSYVGEGGSKLLKMVCQLGLVDVAEER